MKYVLTLFFTFTAFTLFAQFPSNKVFNKFKEAKAVSYTSVNQTGKDSATGKPIPLHVQTLMIEHGNPAYQEALKAFKGLIGNKHYQSYATHKDADNEIEILKYDQGNDYELLIYSHPTDDELYLTSVTAHNLTMAEKSQVSLHSSSLGF